MEFTIFGRTPLHRAIEEKALDTVEILINFKDETGKTSLHRAVENNSS
ncbi:ankyrin repeat domain-containing protein [Candidatus Poribacteria bacterium]|nr:ankyrin repeat domain-containing protein [Candidatus Poribacteria bacterium]